MKPLNHVERTTRLWKFTLFYLLALALPLAASYYLFSDNSIADENQQLKQKLERAQIEQQNLLVQFDTLTSYLRRIDVTDRQLRTESNDLVMGELNKRTQDDLNTIALTLSELRRDSMQMQFAANKRLTHNVLRDFDLFRNNRNTIDFLRQSLTQKGVDVSGKERMAEELAQTKQDLAQTKLLLATYQASAVNRPPPAGGGGGGGGGGNRGNAAQLAELQRSLQASTDEVALLGDQVSFANADCLRLRSANLGKDQRKEMLEQARKGFVAILQKPSSDDMKASVEKMIDVIDKELGRKRGLFGYK